jgi:hypothetical protein
VRFSPQLMLTGFGERRQSCTAALYYMQGRRRKNRRGKLLCVPTSAETSHEGKTSVLQSQQVQTDRTILNNKPGIIVCDNEKRTLVLTGAAISGSINAIKNETLEIRTVDSESESVKMCRLRPQSKILTRYSKSRALIATVTVRLILKYRL